MSEIKEKNIKWWLGFGFCVSLFIFIGIFSYYKMRFLIKGVQIDAKIETSSGSAVAKVVGRSPKATYISLNGREIFIDKNGEFNEFISLLPGYQLITLDAKDKFGNQSTKEIGLYYKI